MINKFKIGDRVRLKKEFANELETCIEDERCKKDFIIGAYLNIDNSLGYLSLDEWALQESWLEPVTKKGYSEKELELKFKELAEQERIIEELEKAKNMVINTDTKHDFNWALKQIYSGLKVTRKIKFGRVSWYLFNDNGKLKAKYFEDNPILGFKKGYIANLESLNNFKADDWVLYQSPKETLSDFIIDDKLGKENIDDFLRILKREFKEKKKYSSKTILNKIDKLSGDKFNGSR